MFKKTFMFVLVFAFVLAACGPAVATPDAMMDKGGDMMTEEPQTGDMMDTGHDSTMDAMPTEDAMMDAMPTEEAMKDDTMMNDMSGDTMMDAPAWFSASFTDARTGATFSVNDFKGKVVLVETLAQWCSNCKQQQGQVVKLHEMLGMRDDFVTFGLDIDTNEKLADLTKYVQTNNFDWMYSVATPDVAREIGNLYGAQFLNPPSTPMLIIDRHGGVHPLPFGIKSAQELYDALQPFLAEDM